MNALPITSTRFLAHLCLVAGLAFGGIAPVHAAADAASLIATAREHLESDRFVEALASARDAVRAAPTDYKAHYYVALAYLGLAQFDDADAATARSLAQAPAEAKPGIEKLAGVIKIRRQGAGSAQAADAALADGMAGKAARLYEQAWSVAQDNPALGLKAADLYANRLGQPVDAGRVLRQVIQAAKGSQAATQAQAELAKLAPGLRQTATELVGKARNLSDYPQQQAALKQAEDADPSYAEIFKLRARLAVKSGSEEDLQQAIKDLARRELATVDLLATLPGMAARLETPAFSEFITDILGAKQVAALKEAASLPQTPTVGRPFTIPELGLKMVPIPEGRFIMGSTQSSDETPHAVTISRAYWLGKYEVTQAEWLAVMGTEPGRFKGANLPVENISWTEAVDFCRKLTEREREAGRLPAGYVYTLPTEAQWEYACRAGTTGDYAGTDNLDDMGWYGGNSGGASHPVGQKRANAWGLHDMHGNVWEWCSDWYGNYPDGAVTNPGGPSSGSDRVNRGGGWGRPASVCRSAYRYNTAPGDRLGNLGFRLALSSSGGNQ